MVHNLHCAIAVASASSVDTDNCIGGIPGDIRPGIQRPRTSQCLQDRRPVSHTVQELFEQTFNTTKTYRRVYTCSSRRTWLKYPEHYFFSHGNDCGRLFNFTFLRPVDVCLRAEAIASLELDIVVDSHATYKCSCIVVVSAFVQEFILAGCGLPGVDCSCCGRSRACQLACQRWDALRHAERDNLVEIGC